MIFLRFPLQSQLLYSSDKINGQEMTGPWRLRFSVATGNCLYRFIFTCFWDGCIRIGDLSYVAFYSDIFFSRFDFQRVRFFTQKPNRSSDFSGFENGAVLTTQFFSRDDHSRLYDVFNVTVENRRCNVCGVVSTLLWFRLLIPNEDIYDFRVI